MKSGNENIEIKKIAEELSKKIKHYEAKLVELRKKCKHEDSFIKNVDPEGGTYKLMKVCKYCNHILSFPTEEDLKNSGHK